MPRTKGTGHKLRDTSMMECTTQTLGSNTAHSGKVFVKSLKGANKSEKESRGRDEGRETVLVLV